MSNNKTKICFGCMSQYSDEYDVCPFCGYHNDLPPKEAYHLTPGTLLQKRYLIGKALGFGGFGITYIGWDFVLERKIAVKEYLPSEFSTRTPNTTNVVIFDGDNYEQYMSGINKFIKEAQCLANLDDIDGIVKVYSSFAENNTAYIIMEYLDGCTLAEKIEKDGKIPPQQAFEMMLPLMTSLAKVHQENILHRDISPDNIFCLKDGSIKLIDFGAARIATAGKSKSLSVIVKPGYAPTEQYRSRGDQGTWTDVYAVAATLYKMITGVTPVDSMERTVKDTLKPPSKLGVKISSSAENAIMNALNIRFEKRTQTIEQFQNQLFSTKEVKRIVEHQEKVDIGKMPTWFKIVGASLAGIALVFGVLLATGVFKHEGHQGPSAYSMPEGKTRVPSLVNQTFDESQETAEKFNLSIITDGAEYTDDIPKDRVYAQDIKVGSLVDINTIVKVEISAGIREVILEPVVGLSQDEAVKILEKNGFKVIINETQKESSYPSGCVCEMDLKANEAYKYKTKVTLTISKGMKFDKNAKSKVPSFVGKTLDEAEKLAEQNGFVIKVTYKTSKTQKAGNVISQSVKDGTSTAKGTEISLVISKGIEKTTVPYLKGRTLKEAESILKEQYLTYDVTYEYNKNFTEGHVISQSIESNTVVDAQTKVNIVVCKGIKNSVQSQEIESSQTPSRTENSKLTSSKQENSKSVTSKSENSKSVTSKQESSKPVTSRPESTKPSVSVIDSGSCGDNVKYTLDSSGTLTISGSGKMTNFHKESDIPWYSNKDKIKSVQIKSGVSNIGSKAFYACNSMKSISIPNSVTSIENWAFCECAALSNVTIPDYVNKIGHGTFSECVNLKSITIPNGVADIMDYTFRGCTKLESVTLFYGVKSIGNYAFYGCEKLKNLKIPDSITNILGGTFENCNNLTSITIPKSVTSIGSGVFSGWSSSQTVYIKGKSSAPFGWDSNWKEDCNAKIVWNA